MSGFFDEYWENLWTGWTPVVVVIFFILGLKLGGWIAPYFNTKILYFILKYLLSFILAGLVPMFSTYLKKK